MIINLLKLTSKDYPEPLRNIPKPPGELYVAGAPINELLELPRLAIVGSRSISPYGRRITAELAGRLAESGVVIVSGLALGVDAEAHSAALAAGGKAIGVLPCPLDRIVPALNRKLAQSILDNGGALVSEYAPGTVPQKQYFIARNRLMSGLAQAVLITEAAEKSGSLHTANFALEQGREVMAVPGNVGNTQSVGTNNLIKAGASVVTSYEDVIHTMGLLIATNNVLSPKGRNDNEQTILNLIGNGISDGTDLLDNSGLSPSAFNQALTMLEISGKVVGLGANHWGFS